jgi:hypothetical protein
VATTGAGSRWACSCSCTEGPAAAAAAVQDGGTCAPIKITGWSSNTEIAKQLAAALVDTNYFSIVSASYQATSTATAGKATFQQYGTYYLDAGKPPGHLLAPRFPGGAIVLSTAKIVGTSWPDPPETCSQSHRTRNPRQRALCPSAAEPEGQVRWQAEVSVGLARCGLRLR